MPGSTPDLAIPYASGTDTLSDWPALNQSQSERIEELIEAVPPPTKVVVTDTTTVNMTMLGSGTTASPYNISAAATLRVQDLSNVYTSDVPVDRDVMVWVAASSRWEFQQVVGAGGVGLPPGGTDGQVLTKQSSTNADALWETIPTPTQPTQPMGFARAPSPQSIPSAVVTTLSVVLDSSSRGGFVLQGNALKVPTAGLYLVTGQGIFSHKTAGGRSMFLRKGSTYLMRGVGAVGNNSTGQMVCSIILPLVAGDLIELAYYQSSGAALAIDSNYNGCSFQVTRISA